MSTDSTRFRAAVIDDLDDIVDFQIRMALESENKQLARPIVEQGAHAIFENPLLGHYVVAEQEAELIACLLVTHEWSEWRNGLLYWIQSVYVVPEHRKQKVFTRLYQHVQNSIMGDPRVVGLRLYVDNDNEQAIQSYKNVGMAKTNYQVFEWLKSTDES